MKKYRRLLIVFLSFTAFCLISGIIFSLAYEDTVIRYLKRYLDKHLITEIEVNKIDFSIFKKFPRASVELKNIKAKSGLGFASGDFRGSTDTLLYAQSIIIEFSFPEIIRGNYKLKNIRINNGKLNLLTDKLGNTNYKIWKGSKSDTSGYEIKLQNIILSNIIIEYTDVSNDINIKTQSEKLTLKANFTDKGNHLLIKGNVRINNLGIGKSTSYSHKNVHADIDLFFHRNDVYFGKSYLEYGKTSAMFSGSIKKAKNTIIDMVFKSDNAVLSDLSEFFPQQIKKFKANYDFNGYVDINGKIKGIANKNRNPHINAFFKLDKGSIINRNKHQKISKLTIEGEYSNGKANNPYSSVITLHECSAVLGKSSIKGKMELNGFNPSVLKGSFAAGIESAELKDFLDIDTLQEVSGFVVADIDFYGTVNKFNELKGADLWALVHDGTLELSDLSFRLKNSKNLIRQINGKIVVDEKIKFRDLSFIMNNSDFRLNCYFSGLPGYLQKKGKCYIEADFFSDNLDLNAILPGNENNPQEGIIKFPDNVSGRANFNANTFIYRKIIAKNVTGSAEYVPKIIQFNYFRLNIPDGSIEGNAIINQQEDRSFIVDCNSKLQKVDIQNLFYVFNNFSQNVILDKNLKGNLTGTIDFKALWDEKLNLEGSTITANSDFEITNGELIGYEPMMGLSRFIAVEELQNIKFQTLKNHIVVDNQKVTIPEMDIRSSAFNIKASGVHNFNNSYDYRIQVELNELLSKKARKKKKEMNDFGIVEDDGLGRINIPIKIVGEGTNYDVSFDKKRAFGLFRQNMSNEKKELKKILNSESSDSSNLQLNETSNKQFIIDWNDEDDEKDFIFEKKEQGSKKEPEFLIEWDDSDTTGNK